MRWAARRGFFPGAGFAILALAALAGCFDKLDVSQVVCTDRSHCPSGYECLIPANASDGRCVPTSLDASASEETGMLVDGSPATNGAMGRQDGGEGMDGRPALDGGSDGDAGTDQVSDGLIDGADCSDVAPDRPPSWPDLADAWTGDPPAADMPDAGALDADLTVDVAAADVPLKARGAQCQSRDECASTFCADGVCCDSACTGQCESCAESASLGTCTTVTGNPRGTTRSPCSGTQPPCAGQCGGVQADRCTYPGAETVCTAAACSSELQAKTASVCNGAGACTASTVVTCDPGEFCNAGACVSPGGNGSTCQGNNQCTSGNCSNGMCCAPGLTNCGGSCSSLSTNANCGTCGHSCAAGSTCVGGSCYLVAGQPCTGAGQCASNFCVDGVCCDTSCAGQCQACAERSKVGTCTTISGNPRGSRPACTGTQPTCAGQCGGSLANQCTYPGSGTVCTPATCSSDTQVTTASVCNGAGACTASTTSACGTGTYCSGGACVPKIGNGGSCQSGSQCASGNCSSWLCCAAGLTNCSGVCVSLSSDANCGSCGRACAAGSMCSGGTCYLVNGQPCTSGAECYSGVCSTFYFDGDGDHYGTSVSIKRCGTSAPSGYANQSGDCCDGDANAHPAQTEYFTTADACASYDYNCDGIETKQPLERPADCGYPTCEMVSGVCRYAGGCTCGGPDPCLYQQPVACGDNYVQATWMCAGDAGTGCWVAGYGGPWERQPCN